MKAKNNQPKLRPIVTVGLVATKKNGGVGASDTKEQRRATKLQKR